jgi:hypothetical protein
LLDIATAFALSQPTRAATIDPTPIAAMIGIQLTELVAVAVKLLPRAELLNAQPSSASIPLE